MNFYYFRTTAVNTFNASAKTVPCKLGAKGVTDLINSLHGKVFTNETWDELKAIERTILSVGKEAEMLLLTSESSVQGKKYEVVNEGRKSEKEKVFSIRKTEVKEGIQMSRIWRLL